MYIEKITINSFGALSGREITLDPGINIIEGENESGKTTVAAFIAFVLYGMKSGRSRYIGWGESSVSGSLTVATGAGKVLIERAAVIAGAKDAVRMTDIETGLEINRGKCPGEVLFGVPEDVFMSTAFVRQWSGARIDGEKMSAAAENLLFSADEAVNTEKAAEKIDLIRRQLLHKNGKGGAIYEKEQKIAALTSRLETAKRASGELINVEASVAELTARREIAVKRREAARQKSKNYETLENLRRFDKLSALKDEVAALYGEKDALLTGNMSEGGQFPTAEYIAELRAVSDGMAATSASITSVSRQLDSLRDEAAACPDRELYDRLVDEEDAGDRMVMKIEKTASKKSVCTLISVLTLIFALVSAVLAFYLKDSQPIYMIALFSAAGVFSVAALITAVVAITASTKQSRDLGRFGVKSVEELRSHLSDIKAEANEFRRIGEDIASAEAELYVQYSVYDDEVREARELLAQRGVTPESDDTISTHLSETLDSCEAVYGRDCEITDMIVQKRAEIGELERQLSGVSEEEVRRDAEFIRADGKQETSAIDLRRELEFTENNVIRLTESIHDLEIRRAQLAASSEDPAAIAVAVDTLKKELSLDRARLDACVLATEALAAAGRGVRESVAPRLRETARTYMSRISGGKYTELGVDAAFGLSVSADGAYRDLDSMSGGTADAAYLSLRLSLVRLLFRRELPPLIFDESFSQMDDTRAGAMLSLLRAEGEPQSLILSCQRRESKLLSDGCRRITMPTDR